MSLPTFRLEITRQGWISSEPSSALDDLCSHGDLRLVIAGTVVAPGTGDNDYTLSTSALALLRTVESDHSPERPVADALILHCGQLLMTSCPIGIDWRVAHADGRVRISDVVRCDDLDASRAQSFPSLAADLTADEYRREVVAFAESAREPFVGIEKRFHDALDRQMYEEFWAEYERRLRRACDR